MIFKYNFGNMFQTYTTYLTYALIWPYTLLIVYTGAAAAAAAWHCSVCVSWYSSAFSIRAGGGGATSRGVDIIWKQEFLPIDLLLAYKTNTSDSSMNIYNIYSIYIYIYIYIFFFFFFFNQLINISIYLYLKYQYNTNLDEFFFFYLSEL